MKFKELGDFKSYRIIYFRKEGVVLMKIVVREETGDMFFGN